MRRIYEKLAAHNRKQAVARARELGLLAGPARHA
jgi:ATP/maltotriose-dependent transcriptional regulator MalT